MTPRDSYYDSYDYGHYWQHRRYEDKAEKIALIKFLSLIRQKKQKIIADIGAGFGRHAPLYVSLFKTVILIDPSNELLLEAKRNLHRYPNIIFKKGRGEKIPLENESVDVALLIRVVHHLRNISPTFKEISRILKPGGFFIIEFANKVHFKALIKAFLRGNFRFLSETAAIDRRSPQNLKNNSIAFLNYHPRVIEKSLEKEGFTIIGKLSVSNFRSPLLKRVLPLRILLAMERLSQPLLAPLNFGPSMFLLARKIEEKNSHSI